MDARGVSSVVRLTNQEGIGIIWIDNPPVNAASLAVRQGIVDALGELSAQDVLAVVIIGAGKTFIAGSDIKEFDAPLEEPQMPAVIEALEDFPRPIVAALHGFCLGGGYELALGCDARIAAPGTKVGLPEVSLGMIPGAGGTQRLPRLIGMVSSVDLIARSRRLDSSEALAIGMIDAIAEGPLLEAALAHARSLKGQKHRLRDRPVADTGCSEAFKAAANAALARARGQNAVREAIKAIEMVGKVTVDGGLSREREVFQRLRTAPEAAALRYQFFAQRQAARPPAGLNASPLPVEAVGVVGGGTMGVAIAFAFLKNGCGVTLLERDEVALARARKRVSALLERDVKAGRLGGDAIAARLTATTRTQDLSDCDLVVEAVFEDMDVKKALFHQLDGVLKQGAILASNTSYLDLDEIASVTTRPADVVGLHFFAPAHIMKLLEIVRGRETADHVLATALALAKRLGKIPIIAGVGEGFVANRIYAAYRQQCEFMVEEGASPEQVDRVLQDFGFALGPFAVSDLSGLDVAWQRRKRLAETRDPNERYCSIPDRLCQAGRLGQKSGAGWYRYEAGSRKSISDPVVERIIEEAAKASGIVRRPMRDVEILERALAAMINESAAALSAGVTQRASDIDVAMVAGYGFPAFRGGPLYWAFQQPNAALNDALNRMIEKSRGVARADIKLALGEIAASCKRS